MAAAGGSWAPWGSGLPGRLHDFVKTVLLQQLVSPGAAVCDLLCGRGTDTAKFGAAGIGSYVGLDLSASALQDAEEEWRTLGKPYTASFCQLDPFLGDLESKLQDKELPFDTICCLGHLQDSFSSEEKVKQLLENVVSLLKFGGIFFGITADASTLWSKYQKAVESALKTGTLRPGSTIPRVKAELYTITFDDDRFNIFGTRYQLRFADDGLAPQSQLLVHFPSLIRLAKEAGLEFIEIQNLDEFFEDYRHLFADAFTSNCSSFLDPKGKLMAPIRDVLSLYTTFIFRKAESYSPGRPALQPTYDLKESISTLTTEVIKVAEQKPELRSFSRRSHKNSDGETKKKSIFRKDTEDKSKIEAVEEVKAEVVKELRTYERAQRDSRRRGSESRAQVQEADSRKQVAESQGESAQEDEGGVRKSGMDSTKCPDVENDSSRSTKRSEMEDESWRPTRRADLEEDFRRSAKGDDDSRKSAKRAETSDDSRRSTKRSDKDDDFRRSTKTDDDFRRPAKRLEMEEDSRRVSKRLEADDDSRRSSRRPEDSRRSSTKRSDVDDDVGRPSTRRSEADDDFRRSARRPEMDDDCKKSAKRPEVDDDSRKSTRRGEMDDDSRKSTKHEDDARRSTTRRPEAEDDSRRSTTRRLEVDDDSRRSTTRRPEVEDDSRRTTRRPEGEDDSRRSTTRRPEADDDSRRSTTKRPEADDDSRRSATKRPEADDDSWRSTTKLPEAEDDSRRSTSKRPEPEDDPRRTEEDSRRSTGKRPETDDDSRRPAKPREADDRPTTPAEVLPEVDDESRRKHHEADVLPPSRTSTPPPPPPPPPPPETEAAAAVASTSTTSTPTCLEAAAEVAAPEPNGEEAPPPSKAPPVYEYKRRNQHRWVNKAYIQPQAPQPPPPPPPQAFPSPGSEMELRAEMEAYQRRLNVPSILGPGPAVPLMIHAFRRGDASRNYMKDRSFHR
ncbi:actin cytoskeleton-regulatory complex protein PAN1-like [Selaginella moellendorffii]|uniref:actin cytoskeleton-regulatory complex protein PAN1-like n=1 Tax=Selaginella moellendorffii TaxID=88036 RepID=UPI000D1C382E|nr:actin cytoskeleton-regulatory complex protein PAN1-like [Selaginella moellendorffii]|eukprot:XP_024544399.1 actin cytoskeleton-regulatory complex protein PAN1-like [Selaginella moellendorffii]